MDTIALMTDVQLVAISVAFGTVATLVVTAVTYFLLIKIVKWIRRGDPNDSDNWDWK